MGNAPEVKGFFDPATWTITYVVYDNDSGDAVIIDPVLDIDPLSWRIGTESVDTVDQFVREKSLKVKWILDTHAHADHLTGMEVLKERFGAPTAIGSPIKAVQEVFAGAYNFKDFPADGRQWDQLLDDGHQLDAGALTVEALHTPGHTPACVTYKIGDTLFTGDALFMPDYGTGRCDFPKGSAEQLYDSITGTIYSQPESTRVFVGHDYMPNGRELAFETTVGESKEKNKQLRANTTREEFVKFRTDRDATLREPKLILQSLQVNIAAGQLPQQEDNGVSYLKIPLNFLGGSK